MAVQLTTSGKLAASPASTTIDHSRGSSISARVLCGGGATLSCVARLSASALLSSAIDVLGDMRTFLGTVGVPTVFTVEAIVGRCRWSAASVRSGAKGWGSRRKFHGPFAVSGIDFSCMRTTFEAYSPG